MKFDQRFILIFNLFLNIRQPGVFVERHFNPGCIMLYLAPAKFSVGTRDRRVGVKTKGLSARREAAVKVTKETVAPTEVILNIEMDTEDEEPFVSRSYRRVVSRMQIPGFRPGKAPRSIVQNFVGRPALVQEALDFMIPETLDRVLKEQDLQAFAQPEVELLEIEPVSFKAVVPLEPLVDLGEFRNLRLELEPEMVTEEQVEDVIEQLRRRSAPWEPVERPAGFGDLVNLDIKGIIDGEQVIDDHGVDFIPEQDNRLPFPGFSIYLEGMTEGQDKEFTLTVPEDYPQASYASKECRFQVTVRSIKEKKLPGLDDEFAKGVGDGYESLGALRDFVQQRLTGEAKTSALRELEEKSLEELLKTASVQASGLVFQRELESMQNERARFFSSQRVDMDAYLRAVGKTEEEVQDELRPRARERITRYLVLRKLAQEEGIEVSPEEIKAEIESLVATSRESEAVTRRSLSTESAQDSIRASILNRKVMQRLVEIVQGLKAEAAPDVANALEGPKPEASPSPAEHSESKPADTDAAVEGAESHAN